MKILKDCKSNPFKELQLHTIDPKTGERIGYLFDSQRCIAEGKGRHQGNKEIMEWQWFAQGQGASSIRIMEKVSDDRFITTQKYILPDGSTMEGKGVMIRKVDYPKGKETVLDER
ncbi:MAG: hypothetical protein JSW00_12125 [Thermoplasmata archaeon]|nr:MAG: hypothetical protein JSW00_12125 [Thermoplasmata archaeon]